VLVRFDHVPSVIINADHMSVIVCADEKLTAFLELESVIHGRDELV
jgi:hypothetical protein